MINLYTIGGYNEVGKNMTVLEIDDEAFIFDCGLYMPAAIELEEKEKPIKRWMLRKAGALPNDFFLDKIGIRKKARAIIPTHAHLDHIGAIPYLASRYNAKIIATPFTCEVLKTLLREEGVEIKNEIKAIQPNSSYFLKHKIELINVTHSTLQTAIVALHTKEGVVLYANDFKFDNSPIVGKRPNYARLKELASQGVLALIVDALYASEERKTPSEKIARGLLEDVLLTTTARGCIVVTTFSSHIARLKSIVDFGKMLGREIIFLGRSLKKYVGAAARLRLINFHKDIKLYSYRNEIEHVLKKVQKNRTRYLLVVTGHQGEHGSILDRMSRDIFPFSPQDHVVFSTITIPVAVNIANRKALEKRLKDKGTRIFTDVHTSGHCMREDLRDFINMLQPKHIIPAHGDLSKLTALAELATELGYKLGKNCHIMQNLQKLRLK